MDKKRAKIKLKEYLRKLDENTKDLPMSKEGSPIVEDVETGEVTYGRPRKFSSGSKLADLIGPSITLQRSGTKETSAYEGEVTRDTNAGSGGVGTKCGNVTLSKSKVAESMPGYSDVDKTKLTKVYLMITNF
jgi:hypothetical protein